MCSISTESHWISATSVLQQCWICAGSVQALQNICTASVMLQSGICPGSGSVSTNITGPEVHLWEKHYWTKKTPTNKQTNKKKVHDQHSAIILAQYCICNRVYMCWHGSLSVLNHGISTGLR